MLAAVSPLRGELADGERQRTNRFTGCVEAARGVVRSTDRIKCILHRDVTIDPDSLLIVPVCADQRVGRLSGGRESSTPDSPSRPALPDHRPRSSQGRYGERGRSFNRHWVSVVLGRDGSVIGIIGRERRLSVPLRTLPKFVSQAFVAVEDKRFYQHNGVDLVGIAGALKDAVTGDLRGASTITQLLVGNMHPDLIDRRDKSPVRKLREQQAAIEMEKHYNKEQILEAFLNQISFGRGSFGIEMGARQYFGKSASELTLEEAHRSPDAAGAVRSGTVPRP
jgi:hypothetical protein